MPERITVAQKRLQELRVVTLMIQVYCHGVHKQKSALRTEDALCADCAALLGYVRERIERCPFMQTKTFCSQCRVHCYKSDMRARIKAVMRYSGPRMLRYHPVLALRHVWLTVRSRTRGGQNFATGDKK